MALLSVRNLSIGYRTGRKTFMAVDNVSFDLHKGRPLGLVGESGCGKTTIGMALMGLLPENGRITSGGIHFNHQDLTSLSNGQWQRIRGKDIAMVFQAAMNALNPVFRVDEQVREAVVAHYPDMSESELEQRVEELFDIVKIPRHRMGNYPHEYSGGMKQRVIIAMALACNPQIIVADEPTTALDVIVQDQILNELRSIQAKTSTGLIFISHDMAVVASICEDICVMYGGQIVEAGTREEVFCSPAHPYTKTLLGSYLSLDNEHEVKVPKMVEAHQRLTDSKACRFISNCGSCATVCREGGPQWRQLSPTHRVYCCNIEGGID
ncbi:MAG: ABC transporter ATP-binding protein [Desulfobacterales bacterium]|nr:ABC transporter ATP-binding protein [Desulfobacterales bacterium]